MLEPVPNQCRDHLVQPFDPQLLDGIESRVATTDCVFHAERLRPHLMRIAEKIVDDEYCRNHEFPLSCQRARNLGVSPAPPQWRMHRTLCPLYSVA